MLDISKIEEHMEIIGADGTHIGTVDRVEDDRIKMTKSDSSSHSGHHHYVSTALVVGIDSDRVHLSINADSPVLQEEGKS